MDTSWVDGPFGQALFKVEVDKLAECMPDLHGHYLLQYSAMNRPVVTSTTLRHQFFAGNEPIGQLQMNYLQLPFRENSLDCVVIHHALDYSPNPHQCLREASRVVVPNGYIVVVGFNPWSALGISRFLPGSLLPSGGKQLTPRRIMDWLALLGFRVEQVESAQFLPPLALKYIPAMSFKIDSMLNYMKAPFGGVYILVARKLVAGRTPIRPQWRVLTGRGLPVPVSRASGARSNVN